MSVFVRKDGNWVEVNGLTGIEVLEDGTSLGTASTINFGKNLVATISSGIASVTTQLLDENSNFIVGNGNTTGFYNNFIGVGAGSSTNGCYNNFFGYCAGHNDGGSCNNFFGRCAGYYNTWGVSNNFFGPNAGFANTTGNNNNFFGSAAGGYNTSGFGNNFFGAGAGRYNTCGCYNNFLGNLAGYSNITGNENVFIGRSAGAANTTGNYNIYLGSGVVSGLYGNKTSGDYNIIMGWNAALALTSGCHNIMFGQNAGVNNTTGSNNTFLGRFAGNNNTTGNSNLFLGYNIGISTQSSYKVIIGSGIFGGQYYSFDSPDPNKDKQLAIGFNTTGTAEYWLVGNENFNIGIGTTNPTSKLHVGGNIRVSGVSTLGTVQISSGIITATSGIITYYGDGSKLSNISSGGGISSISISTNTTNSNQYLTYATGFGNTIGLGATNSLRFNPSTSNLGIGTTNPTSKLHIIGDARIVGTVTATAFVGDGSGLTGVIGVGTGVSVQSSGTTLGAATTINFGSNLTVSSISSGIVTVSGQNYWVQNSSGIHTLGNVGIGTTNPTARLSVASTSSGNSVLTVNDNLSDGSLLRVNNSSGNVLFDVDADGTILFPTTGNVGIGTTITAPTSKVQVEGNVNIKGQTVITDNTILTINENLGDGSLLRVNNSSGNVLFDVDADGTILLPTTGNVGIGTTITAPTSKVQVEGNIGITGDVNITGTTKVKGFTETQGSSTITSNVLSLNAADGTVFTHTTSSQIGIVSFSNISTSSASVQTFTVLVTQGVTPVNVTTATGIGTQLATIVTTSGVGISTNIKVGSGSTIVLTNTAGALDVLTFIVSYNGVGIASTNFTIIGLASTNFR